MQKFHSKMTPRSLYTQFPLTEITYAKVCINSLVHDAMLRKDTISLISSIHRALEKLCSSSYFCYQFISPSSMTFALIISNNPN